MIIFQNGKKFQEYKYSGEEALEREIVNNSKLFFGKGTIYIDLKKKIETRTLGKAIPDGFLFDLSDKDNPEFYIVEVELAEHDFYKHIFPQVTKFFAFFMDSQKKTSLAESIFNMIDKNNLLKKEFKNHLGQYEIYKFIKDVIDDSQNILLIIDDNKVELPEIMKTYSEWGKMVKLLILKKFTNDSNSIYTLDPSFENIEYGDAEQMQEVDEEEDVEYNEEFHLDGVAEDVKKAYFKIKEDVLQINSDLIFNPKKLYISIIHGKNIAFFKFRKKKIRLVVMMPEEHVRERIKKHSVKHLSEGVQKFWNGPSCEIIIDNNMHIEEVVELLKTLITKDLNEDK